MLGLRPCVAYSTFWISVLSSLTSWNCWGDWENINEFPRLESIIYINAGYQSKTYAIYKTAPWIWLLFSFLGSFPVQLHFSQHRDGLGKKTRHLSILGVSNVLWHFYVRTEVYAWMKPTDTSLRWYLAIYSVVPAPKRNWDADDNQNLNHTQSQLALKILNNQYAFSDLKNS